MQLQESWVYSYFLLFKYIVSLSCRLNVRFICFFNELQLCSYRFEIFSSCDSRSFRALSVDASFCFYYNSKQNQGVFDPRFALGFAWRSNIQLSMFCSFWICFWDSVFSSCLFIVLKISFNVEILVEDFVLAQGDISLGCVPP